MQSRGTRYARCGAKRCATTCLADCLGAKRPLRSGMISTSYEELAEIYSAALAGALLIWASPQLLAIYDCNLRTLRTCSQISEARRHKFRSSEFRFLPAHRSKLVDEISISEAHYLRFGLRFRIAQIRQASRSHLVRFSGLPEPNSLRFAHKAKDICMKKKHD